MCSGIHGMDAPGNSGMVLKVAMRHGVLALALEPIGEKLDHKRRYGMKDSMPDSVTGWN